MNTTQKMIAAVALVAVLAVAAVGVGYAYTAQTSNSGNATNATYGIITIGTDTAADYNTGKIDGKLNFDTKTVVVDNQVKKYAALNNAVETTIGEGTAYLVQLGASFIVTVDDTKAANGTYDLVVGHTETYGTNGLDQTTPYYIGIKAASAQTYKYIPIAAAADSTATLLDDETVAQAASDVYTIALFANGGATEPSIETSTLPAPTDSVVFTGSVLKFTADFTESI